VNPRFVAFSATARFTWSFAPAGNSAEPASVTAAELTACSSGNAALGATSGDLRYYREHPIVDSVRAP
jgi:hypothetical protein